MDFQDSTAMRSNLLVTLFKQAIKTFAPINSSEKEFSSGFRQLKSILDNVRADDVRLDPSFNEAATWESQNKAPCTYIEIFENQNFNMGIFIIKPGFKMPLHDHPHMHGLLKVISGNARIKSFTKIKPDEEKNSTSLQKNIEMNSKSFLTEISDNKMCDANSESCVLTPEDSNYHEIEAINGPSAFLDILAPPYSTFKDNKVRECRYYKVIQEINPKLAQLEEMPSPKWFYCDQAPYLGPVLI